jgi:hypothetical protein
MVMDFRDGAREKIKMGRWGNDGELEAGMLEINRHAGTA